MKIACNAKVSELEGCLEAMMLREKEMYYIFPEDCEEHLNNYFALKYFLSVCHFDPDVVITQEFDLCSGD